MPRLDGRATPDPENSRSDLDQQVRSAGRTPGRREVANATAGTRTAGGLTPPPYRTGLGGPPFTRR